MKVLILNDIYSHFPDKKKAPELYARANQILKINKVRDDVSLVVAGKEKGGVFILQKDSKDYQLVK